MWPWLGRQLRDFFRGRGFDVIHVHAPYNPPFPAWAIANAPDDAVVVATFHSVFPQTLGMDILAEWTRPWIERLDGRICVSEACIGSLVPYYPYAYDVIPNGIDADHFSPDAEPAPGLRGEQGTIVFVGRFDPRNGLGTMIEAHRILQSERGDVRLVVVGDGPLRAKYEHQITDEQRPHVHFAGRLNRSRPNHLVAGDIFCTPCNRASFGMVLLEAMSCGAAGRGEPDLGIPARDAGRRPGGPRAPRGRRRAVRRRARQAPRRPRRAPPDGRGRAPDGARALRVAASRREARGLLRRPARRCEACMGKRDVIVRFVIAPPSG